MVEKDKKFRQFISSILSANGETIETTNLWDLIGAIANWAGKGKDELVQIICREIGVAAVAMLKGPAGQILENKKLQITIELVSKKAPLPGKKVRKKVSKKRPTKKKAARKSLK